MSESTESGAPRVLFPSPGYRQPTDDELQHALDTVTGGLWPRWRNEEHTGDDLCDVYLGERRCQAERAWIAWFGCVHEHVAPSDVCAGHIERAERDSFRCQLCYDKSGEVILSRMIKKERPPEWDDTTGTCPLVGF